MSYSAHALMENRNGTLVDFRVEEANGYAERDTAIEMLADHVVQRRRVTVAGDAGYDTAAFVHDCSALNVTPHIAQTREPRRRSAIDDRTARHAGYLVSQCKRKRVEEENMLLVGRAGVGKSHIAQALGQRACRAGHQVVYVSAHELLTQLRSARADATHDRKMLRFTTPALLIVDDLGLRPLVSDEPIDLYEIIRQRYERGSTIFTSNRAIEEWPPLFGDLLLASAALDRLLHHAHVIEMDGDTFRNPPSGQRTKAAGSKST